LTARAKLASARAAERAARAEADALRGQDRSKALARWRPTPAAILGLSIVALVSLVAITADQISPKPPDVQELIQRLEAPSWSGGEHGYLMGSDHLGRDILSRVIHGARVSLVVGFAGVALSGGVGVTLGLVAGYLGGWWERVIMRIADVQQAIPALVLAIAVVAVLRPSLVNLIVVLAITTWVGFARVVRSEVLAVRETLLVEAARVIGATEARIITRHILPNVAASIIVIASLMVANLILFEASLSFLGLGVPPTVPSWGRMVFEGIEYVDTAWWIPLVPGLAVMITVLGINLSGDWLRDALDPRQRMR
jgi:peptide/nickel transport system permease protein